MGGQAGNRGYLVQVLIAVLDAFDSTFPWTELTIEPTSESEKVDIAWIWPGHTRVVQVKSSQNPITVPHIKEWSEQLERSVIADYYELRLIGPISAGAAAIHIHGNVHIPTPYALNVEAMIEQAAHKLDRYLDRRRHTYITAVAREILVQAISTRLSAFSTQGKPISRIAFEELLAKWTRSISEGKGSIRSFRETPHQLPSPPSDFIGRTSDLTALRVAVNMQQASKGTVILGIRGSGGVGKTSLALQLAHELKPAFADGDFYLDFRGASNDPSPPQPLSSIGQLTHILRSVLPSDYQLPDTLGSLSALYRSVLTEKHTVLLCDNVLDAKHIEALIPPPGNVMIITSRTRFHIAGIYPHDLGMFSVEDAVDFLLKIAPRIANETRPTVAELVNILVGSEQQSSSPITWEAVISRLCGYLPMALRLAGAALADRPNLMARDYAVRMKQEAGRLDLLDKFESDPAKRVTVSLSVSETLMSEPLRLHWQQLGAFTGHFDLPAAAFVWGALSNDAGTQSSADTADMLAELVRMNVLDYDAATSYYRMHDLTRIYVRLRADPSMLYQAEARFAGWYSRVLEACDYHSHSSDIGRLSRVFNAEWPNIVAGILWATKHANADAEAAKLCLDYAIRSGRMVRWVHPAERLRILSMAAEVPSLRGNLMAMAGLSDLAGEAFLNLNGYNEARTAFTRCLELSRQLADAQLESSALVSIGRTYEGCGEPLRAIEYYERALSVQLPGESHNERRDEMVEPYLAGALLLKGDTDGAIAHYQRHLSAARRKSDRDGENLALINLGIAMANSDAQASLEYLEKGLEMARFRLCPPLELEALVGLASCHAILGNTAAVNEAAEEGIEKAKALGNRKAHGRLLSARAIAYSNVGKDNEAIECMREQIAIARDVSDRQAEAGGSWNLGKRLWELGQVDDALVAMRVLVDYYRSM